MALDPHPSTLTKLNFGMLFDAMPSPCVALTIDLRIVAVNEAYLRATKSDRATILGRNVFEVFPNNPDDPSACGEANLMASLQRVRQTKCADTMAIQKYDIRVQGPDQPYFEERFWSPINAPVLDAEGEVVYIIHRVEDVTDFVKAKHRTARMASRIEDQALQIEIANSRLREANATLEQRVADRTNVQRATEERLRARELRFRLLADSIPQIVWIIDDLGRGVFFNKQWAEYTGVTLDTIAPEKISENFVHPDDRAVTMQAWELA